MVSRFSGCAECYRARAANNENSSLWRTLACFGLHRVAGLCGGPHYRCPKGPSLTEGPFGRGVRRRPHFVTRLAEWSARLSSVARTRKSQPGLQTKPEVTQMRTTGASTTEPLRSKNPAIAGNCVTKRGGSVGAFCKRLHDSWFSPRARGWRCRSLRGHWDPRFGP